MVRTLLTSWCRWAVPAWVGRLALLTLPALLTLAAVVGPGPTQAATSPPPAARVALVMGNAAYPEQRLRNPVNDARAMAAMLRQLGFEVMEVLDADKRSMESAILAFGRKLSPQGVGLFFYAGHGLQVKGRNYLVPVDGRIDNEAATRVAAVDVELLLEQMADARNGVNVVILDACRNNPFERRLRGSSQGLAAIDAARGTLVAYATSPGSVAADGDGTHGLYTEALLQALKVPGLKIEEVFKRVRIEVSRRSNGQQTPWESSSLTGDLVVNVTVQVAAPTSAPTSALTAAPPAPAPVPATLADRDALFWASIKDSRDRADHEAYLRQFPNGTFAELARRRLSEAPAPVAAGVSRFDGRWNVDVRCAAVDGKARGYRNQFVAEVKHGLLSGQHGQPGENTWLLLEGPIAEDGSALLQARGRTGDPSYTIGSARPGSPYRYTVKARFDERQGSGQRVELRPCELSFVRQ